MKPVTTILKIKYKEGFKEECLQWMQETASIASSFEGFSDKTICFSDNNNEILNIFTFSSNEHLERWENSAERTIQSQKAADFIESVIQKNKLAGLEFMLSSPKTPKKWKMILVTVIVIFTLLNTLVPQLQQLFSLLDIPPLIKSLLGVIIMVSLMTFLILPAISRILRKWLFS